MSPPQNYGAIRKGGGSWVTLIYAAIIGRQLLIIFSRMLKKWDYKPRSAMSHPTLHRSVLKIGQDL